MKNIENNNDTFLARWLSDELTKEEKSAFESSEDFPIYRKIVEGADLQRAPGFDAETMLSNIKLANKVKQTSTNWIMRIAATVLLLLASYFTFDYLSVVSHTSQSGEIKTISLPDGTEVTLNAASTLTHKRWRWTTSREVNLSGEAYFEVTKGSTFIVKTNEGSVTVLGTIFDVRDAEGFLEVTCYEGRVKVNSGDVEKILTTAMGFRRIEDKISDKKTNSDLPTWINAESTFDGVPSRYVFEELTNQYGVQFVGTIPSNQIFTGSFPNDDLDLALNIVMGTLDIRYQINNNVVELQPE